MKAQNFATVAGISLVICVASAMVASSNIVGESWDGLGRMVWITLLITIPSFALFVVFGVAALRVWLKNNRR